MAHLWKLFSVAGSLAALVLALPGKAAPPAPKTRLNTLAIPVIRLSVEPANILLSGPRSQARLLVTAHFSDGSTRDVTAQSSRTVNSKLAAFDSEGWIRPQKNGQTVVQFAYGGKSAAAKVTVRGAASPIPVSFNNEVVPILTRYGCNQGACHGSQFGKGGYKLSLAGFDTDLDYRSTVRQFRGRRISTAAPDRSLLLLKPAMKVPHGGGLRLTPGTRDYQTLALWLKQGAPGPINNEPQVEKLEVFPAERILRKQDGPQQLAVRATYTDGTTRDVTAQARVATLNDAVASCTPDGTVQAVGKGQTAIMVRYGGQVTVAMTMVPFDPLASNSLFPVSATNEIGKGSRAANQIDVLVARKQKQLNLSPSPLCDDRTFARRVFLDLIGTTPTAEEMKTFLADKTPNKRAKLIDAVLDRPEYADYWTLKWGDLLRSNRVNLGSKGMWSFSNWIRGQMKANRPADQFVRDLVLAQGSTFTNGPSNFYRVASNPQDLAETTSQVFLGVRMQCARCHHHPFEKWSQADYYQFAAFFARVGLKGSDEIGIFGNEQVVRVGSGGEVYHPKTGALMRPTPLGVKLAVLKDGKSADPDADGDRRRALADWLVSKNNRMFARNIVNRYWGYLFVKGLVNPIDDMRATNPPTNAALLDHLADEFMKSGYDLKALLRLIANTQTYQRSAQATPQNVKDELFFTHYYPRRLQAEALLDAIDFACGTREKYPELPMGTRAIQLPDPAVSSEFLDTFGRPPRLIACECERMPEANISQALRLMNGELINRKVGQGDGRIAKLIAAKKSDDTILNDLYMATLGRLPGRRERNQVMGTLAFTEDRKSVFEDVLLTLLNSKEFLFNH